MFYIRIIYCLFDTWFIEIIVVGDNYFPNCSAFDDVGNDDSIYDGHDYYHGDNDDGDSGWDEGIGSANEAGRGYSGGDGGGSGGDGRGKNDNDDEAVAHRRNLCSSEPDYRDVDSRNEGGGTRGACEGRLSGLIDRLSDSSDRNLDDESDGSEAPLVRELKPRDTGIGGGGLSAMLDRLNCSERSQGDGSSDGSEASDKRDKRDTGLGMMGVSTRHLLDRFNSSERRVR